MSGLILAAGVVGVAATEAQLFLGAARQIGPYFPTVSIEETLSDRLMITRKPVEYGADISDHAYKCAATFTMRAGWSASGFDALLGQPLDAIYDNMLQLQASATFITVVTGKRTYLNCLIAEIRSATDVETENALMLDIDFEQVILVNVAYANIAPQQAQAAPADTAPVVNQGSQPLQTPKNQSILYSLFGKA